MKTKFNLLYESILKKYVINNNKVISESVLLRIPNLVKDSIARFISEYLYDEIGYLDWTDNEPFYYYNDLKHCHKLWKNDPDLNNHYSNPLEAYKEIASGFVKYDKNSNTVTMNIGQWNIDTILDFTGYTTEEFLEILNKKFNKIDEINFVWINDFEETNNSELILQKVVYSFATSVINSLIHKNFGLNIEIEYPNFSKDVTDLKELNHSFNGVGYVIHNRISLGYQWFFKKERKVPKIPEKQKYGELYTIIYQPENSNNTYIDFVYGIIPDETEEFKTAARSIPEKILNFQYTLDNSIKNLSNSGLNLPFEICLDKPLSKISVREDLKSETMENTIYKIVHELITCLEKIDRVLCKVE